MYAIGDKKSSLMVIIYLEEVTSKMADDGRCDRAAFTIMLPATDEQLAALAAVLFARLEQLDPIGAKLDDKDDPDWDALPLSSKTVYRNCVVALLNRLVDIQAQPTATS